VIAGKDKGRKGKVAKSYPKERKITVEGINIARKHRRAKNEREKGQVVEIARPMDVSNVKLVCPKCGQASRVGYKIVEEKKYRLCKKCRQEI